MVSYPSLLLSSVCKVTSTIGYLSYLPDHLVGLEEEGWGNGQAEGLGGFE
jgi:hypothetical protein